MPYPYEVFKNIIDNNKTSLILRSETPNTEKSSKIVKDFILKAGQHLSELFIVTDVYFQMIFFVKMWKTLLKLLVLIHYIVYENQICMCLK